jgi:hypothetical protein
MPSLPESFTRIVQLQITDAHNRFVAGLPTLGTPQPATFSRLSAYLAYTSIAAVTVSRRAVLYGGKGCVGLRASPRLLPWPRPSVCASVRRRPNLGRSGALRRLWSSSRCLHSLASTFPGPCFRSRPKFDGRLLTSRLGAKPRAAKSCRPKGISSIFSAATRGRIGRLRMPECSGHRAAFRMKASHSSCCSAVEHSAMSPARSMTQASLAAIIRRMSCQAGISSVAATRLRSTPASMFNSSVTYPTIPLRACEADASVSAAPSNFGTSRHRARCWPRTLRFPPSAAATTHALPTAGACSTGSILVRKLKFIPPSTIRTIRIGGHITAFKNEDREWSGAIGYARDSDHRSGLYVRIGMLIRR